MHHIDIGQVWEAMSGGRGTPRVRRRKIVSIEGAHLAVEEDGAIKCTAAHSFQKWITNYGAVRTDG